MKNLFIMLFLSLFALPLQGQKYAKVLKQKLTSNDLAYMTKIELSDLKNELIAIKGKEAKKDREFDEETILPFLDDISKANLRLITNAEQSTKENNDSYSDQELFDQFLISIDQKATIPLYLQVRFLNRCQYPSSTISKLASSNNFYTIVITEPTPMVGPQVHKIITLNKNGGRITSKHLHGNIELKNNQIIHESYNSLIKYVYTIDEQGNFDKETPSKKTD